MTMLYMETTNVPAAKTAAEVEAYLADMGATEVLKTWESGEISGLQLCVPIRGAPAYFSLPVRIEPVFTHLQKKRTPKNRPKNAEKDLSQAIRVAWRQILRWIQAQFAMVDIGMAKTEEIFLPYLKVSPNETVFERYEARKLLKD